MPAGPHRKRDKFKPRGVVAVLVNEDSGETRVVDNPKLVARILSSQSSMASDVGQASWYEYGSTAAGMVSGRRGVTMREIRQLGVPLREIMLPHPGSRSKVISRIEESVRDFYLLRRWARDFANFASAGFQLTSTDTEMLDWCRNLARHLNWDAIDYMVHYQMATVDSAVVWWKYYEPGLARAPAAPEGHFVPEWAQVIDPEFLTPSANGMRLDVSKIEPIASIVRKPEAKRTPKERAELKKWPKIITDAIKKGQSIALSDLPVTQFGHMVINHWSKLDWDAFPLPLLYTILSDIQYLLMCQDVDYQGMYHMKAGIVVWGIGPETPTKDSPRPRAKELAALETNVKNLMADKNPVLAAGNDLSIRWFVPPDSIFSPAKYQPALQRVLDVLGYPNIFYPVGYVGEGQHSAAYSSGYLSIKPFDQSIVTSRRMTGRAHEKFFWVMAWMNEIGGGKGSWMSVAYNKNILTEPRIVLQTAQLLAQQGMASHRTTVENLGLDAEYEKAQKLRELEELKKHPGLFSPYFAVVRGADAAGTQGGPGNPGAGRPSTGPIPAGEEDTAPRPAQSDVDIGEDEEP